MLGRLANVPWRVWNPTHGRGGRWFGPTAPVTLGGRFVIAIKDAKKLLRDTFRAYGARPDGREARGMVRWKFPDGRVLIAPDPLHPTWVAAQCRNLERWYGPRHHTDAHRGMTNRPGKPTLDLENLTASDHAKQRLRLMQGQAAVTFQEVLYTLRTPERVLWSDRHESWLWVRDRIAVSVMEARGGGHVIKTVMWATQDLFDQHPRPEASA